MTNNNNSDDYQKKFENHKKLLEAQYNFPCNFMFKFIVPIEQEYAVRALFPDHQPKIRASKNGNYLSLSITYYADSSDLVLAIYEKASTIKGLIAL